MTTLSAPRRSPSPTLDPVRIVAVKGGVMAGTWEFKKASITLGRAPTTDVRLDTKDISRLHCTIEVRADGIYVKDGGSTNGTWVNRQRVSGEQRISPRDLVQVGGYRFKAFMAPVQPEAEPSVDGPRVQLTQVPARAPAPVEAPMTSGTDSTSTLQLDLGEESGDPLPRGELLLEEPSARQSDVLPANEESNPSRVPGPEIEVDEASLRAMADARAMAAARSTASAPTPFVGSPAVVDFSDRDSSMTPVEGAPVAKPGARKFASKQTLTKPAPEGSTGGWKKWLAIGVGLIFATQILAVTAAGMGFAYVVFFAR